MAKDDLKRIVLVGQGQGFIVATIFLGEGDKLDPGDVDGLDLDHLPQPEVVQLG